MQRLLCFMKTITSIASLPVKNAQASILSPLQQFSKARLLQPTLPILNPVCSFKVRGRLRRRCKSCYFVVRDERLYVICPKFPRHKQMAMKPKPLNTWILTHATQSPVRPCGKQPTTALLTNKHKGKSVSKKKTKAKVKCFIRDGSYKAYKFV